MRRTSTAARRCATHLVTAAMAAALLSAAATSASATNIVFGSESASPGTSAAFDVQDARRPVRFDGNLARDVGAPSNRATGVFNGTAAPGHLSVSADLKTPVSVFDFAATHVFTQVSDIIRLQGGEAGQSVTLHRALTLTGSATATLPNGTPGATSRIQTSLRVAGEGVQVGPYFGAFGNDAYATLMLDNPHNQTSDRNLLPQRTIDLALDLVVGQDNFFFLDLDLETFMTVQGGASAHLTADYDLTWDTDPGFLTLDDAEGRDTGVRAPTSLRLASNSGFNYLVANSVGGGAGGAPEPASWAMMLVGFFGVGGLLRTRRVTVA